MNTPTQYWLIFSGRDELSHHGCVQAILEKDVGCDMGSIELVMRRDEVRQGLLDSVDLDYCGEEKILGFDSNA